MEKKFKERKNQRNEWRSERIIVAGNTDGAVVDVRNGDMPASNPSYPKPNDSPDQAGSSGSFSDADLNDGISGGEGKGGSDGGGSHMVDARGSAASRAMSGTLLAVGLTVVPYLFYKYTPAFSMIKSFFGNNLSKSRKKSPIRHELNTITDNSTEYLRSDLTESVLADTATEYYIPYTR
ncbi:KIR-like CYIR protein [Plasmodium cynomolgi strain B]|uniref:KIR-like CYIR protein n=1 Tax=Plasmodium cynomolgi (strain B) TaxID=1120755 RepID=K6V6S5_PLACD|nr:KIR-like CYIR protein [Plasmodium cynomolgi strain B]GAB64812.1 KIR-like CYIR protein [Plasmodium cynomolgi strain B]